MSGDVYFKLLCVVAFSINTEAWGHFPPALPERRPDVDYFTKCDFGSDLATFCDWTSEGFGEQTGTDIYLKSPSAGFRLESRFLNIPEDSCLEFWYHKPSQKSSELKVLQAEDIQQTLLWSSDTAGNGDWRQVYIPLKSHTDNSIQVTFERSQSLQKDDETSFDRFGIRRGHCGAQCHPEAEFWTDETTRCTCNDEQLTCSYVPRSNGDTTFGTCNVDSDSHFTTFDGFSLHFDGSCTYVLSRVCDDSGYLPEFSVEVRNEKKGDSSVSFVEQVNVNVQGLRVAMLRTERRRVMVNGIWRNLPLHLKENTVVVDAEKGVLVLHTDFNMSVSYTASGAVQVVLPNHYSNRVCGICGNFNQLTADDFKAPDGSQVGDARDLGKSWQATDADCEEPKPPRFCTETEELEYSSDLYCGVLTSRHGPFAECSSVLSAEKFLQNCMFHMCTTNGDPEALCDTIQTFTDTCSKAGIPVSAWRNSTFCPLVCGPHSHYNACASGCQETCSSLDAAGSCGICEERCECDDGFVLSGGTCVLPEDCGCWVNEQHYAITETFMEGDCDTLCQCLGQGNIQCSSVSCPANEVCMVQDGVMGCFPSSPVTCSVYGDPHYITFDGKAYSFWGTCNYTIAKTCGPAKTQFTITARNEGQENSTTSSLNSVALDMEGFHVTIRKNNLVYVNGVLVNLPADFGSVHLSLSGHYSRLVTDFGLRLLFDGNSRLFVQVDERHRGMLCGLCGTYSGSQFDDFLTPDGNTVAHPHEFASSWNTDDIDWPCSNGSPDPPACDPALENAAFTECSVLFGDAFTECHWFVPPQIYVSSCISDYCTYQGDKSQLCSALEDYVSACELAEVFLPNWRNHTFCDLDPSPPTTDAPKPTLSPDSCTWSCNFDQDLCGWEQLIQDSFDWTRWSSSTPSDLTGPTGDHTTGNGFYMYIEGDSVVHGDSARLMSPVCHTFEKQCVSFWYHMYGPANAMALNLYLYENNRALKIWSKANNQGNRWFQGRVEIKPQAGFQIIVEGIRGSDPRSDVAIDDVAITYGGCEDTSTEDIDSSTLAPPLTSSNSIIPHPVCGLNCDFESDICSWTQLLTDVFDWTRHTGSTPTLMTGPSSDHTTGSGFYLYIEGDSATHGDTARILSTECADIQPQCFQFWYHMHGTSSTMGLSVYHLEGNLAKEVWRKRENQGDTWHRALVDLRPTVKFQVIFEGRRGSTALSDVAIDDVSLHRGTCDDLVNQVNPSPSVPPAVQTTATSVQTTARPIQTTTTSVQTTARPIQTTTTSVQTTAGPIQTTTTSVQTTAGPIQTTTESLQTTAGPIQTTTTSVQTTAGPIQTTTESLQTTAKPIQTTTTSVQTTAGPSQTTTTSVQTTAKPIQTTTTSVQTTAGPIQTTTTSVQTTAKPIQTTTTSVQTTAGPSQTTTESLQTTAGPSQTTTESLQTTAGPIQTTTESVQSTARPIQTTTESVQSTARPIQTTTESLQTTAKPIQTTTESVQSTAKPIQTTAESLQSTAKPIQTTTESLQTTAKPIQTTTESLQTTAKPIQTTTESLQTTARPTQTTTTSVQTTVRPITTTDVTNAPESICGLNCDFESDICSWTQLLTDVFDWTRHTGSTPTLMTGPSSDHTTGSGFYLYIEGDSATHGDTARLLSTECADIQPQCFQFWYHMHGTSSTMGLSVYHLEGNLAKEVWRKRENQGDTWHRALVDLRPTVKFQVIFEGRRGSTALSDVAIDDVSLHRGTCDDLVNQVNPSPSVPPAVQTTATSVQTTARPIQTTTTSVQTTAGPIQTTTTSVQTTAKPIQTTTTSVQTTAGPIQTTTESVQSTAKPIQTTAESLQSTAKPIQTTTESVQSTAGPIQTTTESVQSTAKPIQTTAESVQSTAGPIQTTTESLQTTAKPIQTTTESLQTTARPTQTTTTSVQTTVRPITTTDVTNAPESICGLNCDFESDICSWTQLLTDVFDWTRHTGSTPTLMTGPSSDHTTGSGFYLYIEGDSATHGDTARLLSTECADIQPQCFQFWYHMHGTSSTMGLSVYHLEGNLAKEVWRKRENQGDTWHRALVDLRPTVKFQVIFEGRRGSTALSDVAIDDVSLHRGTCDDLVNQVNPSPSVPPAVQTTATSVQTTARPIQTTTTSVQTTAGPIQTTTTSVQTTAGPIQTTTESLQSTAKPIQTTTESLQTTAKPIQTTTESLQTTAKPIQTTTESVQSTAKPIQTTTESLQTTAKPIQTTTESLQTTAKPIQTTTESLQTTAKPIQTTTESLQTTAKPIQTTTESLQTTAKPIQTTTESVQSTAKPIQTTTESLQTTAKPIQTTTESLQTTAKPIQTTTESLQTTAKPIQTTTESVQSTAKPIQTTTESLQTTAKPIQTTTESLQTTAKPIQTTTESVQSTAKPIQTTTESLQTTARPIQTTTESLQTTARPIQTTTTSVQTTAGPIQTTTESLQSTAKPIQTTTESLQTTAKPIQTTTESLQTTAKPIQTTTESVQSTAKPIQTTTTSVQTTAGPIQTTTESVQTTAGPIQTTTESVQTTAGPIQTTTESLQTTAGPIQTTTESLQTTAGPIQTTTESLQTTAGPIQTTTESLQTTAGPIQTTTTSVDTTVRPITTTDVPNTPESTPSCPMNSHYTDCIPPCQPTCSHLHGPPGCNTEEPCVQGCVCDDGFVLKQRACVPINECGCKDSNDNIHNFGEVWYDSHCSQRCTCEQDGEIVCEDHECDGDEICHMTEQGQYSCQSSVFSKCTIDDDPEYRTFDNMKHEFKGKNSYILVQTTGLPSNIPHVNVVTINKKIKDESSEEESSEEESSEEDSSEEDDDGRLRAVRIRVYNHTVEFQKGHKVTVDGLRVRPPVSPSEGMKIWKRSSRVFLKTDFGLTVEFNGKHKAEITLAHMFKRKIGGLCGNFDGVSKNDMMKPNGEQAKNVKEFGESWRTIDRRRRFSLQQKWSRSQNKITASHQYGSHSKS